MKAKLADRAVRKHFSSQMNSCEDGHILVPAPHGMHVFYRSVYPLARCLMCHQLFEAPEWDNLPLVDASSTLQAFAGIVFVRVQDFDNSCAKRVLDRGRWVWAIHEQHLPAFLKTYSDHPIDVIRLSPPEIATSVVSYPWEEVDAWVCGRVDESAVPPMLPFSPNHVLQPKSNQQVRAGGFLLPDPWDDDVTYFENPFACVIAPKPAVDFCGCPVRDQDFARYCPPT